MITSTVVKVDERLGLVFGWALVSKIDGQPYFDLQGDHVPEDVLMKATLRFAEGDRVMKVMHAGAQAGRVVFAMPLTEDVARAFGVQSPVSGLMIAVKPDDPAVLKRFADGELRGFSIGGRGRREVVGE